MRSLLSTNWLRPNQHTTTKPNIGKLVLTNVLLAQLGLEPIMVTVTAHCTVCSYAGIDHVQKAR
jgi:hypothetical protein